MLSNGLMPAKTPARSPPSGIGAGTIITHFPQGKTLSLAPGAIPTISRTSFGMVTCPFEVIFVRNKSLYFGCLATVLTF